MAITRDEDVLGGEPRIEGTRIGVRHVAARVVESGQSPAYVADQLDLSLGDVYGALSYYYDNVEVVESRRTENERAFDRLSSETLKPTEPIE